MGLTAAEEKELAMLEKEVGGKAPKVAQAKGLTPEEEAELQALEQEVGQAPQLKGSLMDEMRADPNAFKRRYSATDINTNPEKRALNAEGAARVLEYPGGLLRTGLAGAVGLLPGRKQVVTSDDWGNALKGNAPRSAEYLERMGVSPGYEAEVPFTDKRVSGRDVEGFALDVVTDPLTLLARAGKLNPVGDAMTAAGKKTYKSGFKKIDERLIEKGKTPISDVLLEHGAPTGTTKKIAGDIKEIGKTKAKERAGLYQEISDRGASVDLGHPLPKTEAVISKYGRNRGMKKAVEEMTEKMNEYKSGGPVDVATLSEWKSALYDSLPESAYAGGKIKGPWKEFEKAMADDFKDAIVQAGDVGGGNLGSKVADINDTWGSVISAEKPTAMQIRRGETTNAATSVDGILAALAGPAAVATKKSADIAKTTWARTKVGKGLMTAGKSGLPQGLINRGLLERLTPEQIEFLRQQQMQLSGEE